MLKLQVLGFILLPLPALAGRPFITDDAALTTAGACQIESWTQHSETLSEYWTLPACNPYGNFELAAGATRFQAKGEDWLTRPLIQGKTLFKALEPGSYGLGLAFGGLIADGDESVDGPATLYAYLPLSVSLAEDRVIVHANLGWMRDRTLDINRVTWGLGAKLVLAARWSAFAEFYGDDVADPSAQTGVSYALLPDFLQLDVSAGRQLGSQPGTTYFAVGLNVYFPPFR